MHSSGSDVMSTGVLTAVYFVSVSKSKVASSKSSQLLHTF
eukprot:COSAG06_NODE_268_length_18811_cov_4.369549_7_plen_40_part_00